MNLEMKGEFMYRLFGPEAYGRYLLKPILLSLILFFTLFFITGLQFKFIIPAYIFGSIPSGYHLINRFLYKWFYREESLEWRIAVAMRGGSVIDLFFFLLKVAIKIPISFFIGIFSFPYICYELIKEIRN
ncbi:hypothetical protein ACFQ5D_22760 [Paenibacillus farraposensis]|uniref:Uncharacterized protein n=1 Tax=Paenibacillus farraposensis TaxID=2807095 RepID=A0ABW4DHF0_9BACL|nr:hypothetical protein [Paenibacillus farraposensis]MCC3380601.1 hypothetical protein [Paenibacillus farraposensis]